MKRLSSLCLLFMLAFSGCIHITGVYDGRPVDLRVELQPRGTAAPQTATPRETPAPSITPTSTVTRTPSPTPTATRPVQTGTPIIVPTHEITAIPTVAETTIPKPTPTAQPGACIGVVLEDGTRLRSSPSTANLSNLVDVLAKGDVLTIEGRSADNNWFRIWDGWVWASLVSVTGTGCANLPISPDTRLGLHLIFSARWEDVSRILPRISTIKGTDGTEGILRQASAARPDLLIVYRAIFLDIGKWDCPQQWGQGDARIAADQWFAAQFRGWKARGLIGLVDYFEPMNECLYVGNYENAFYLRLLELANSAGVCLAVYADAFGNPEIAQFSARLPVLDAILAQPCRPGRYHAIATHIYSGVAGGDWLFGRYRLFLAALPERVNHLPWLITEYSAGNGRGAVDCAALWQDWRQANEQFSAQVLGVHLYSVGGGSEWSDISSCLGGA